MKIYDNLDSISKNNIKTNFTISMDGNNGFCYEGKYKIEKFDETEIVLKLSSKFKIVICGYRLCVGTLAPYEIGINGVILSIEFV